MAITSVGYDGTVDEVQWARLSTFLGAEYAVAGANDWKVETVPGQDRTVRVLPGVGYGYGVLDESDSTVTIQLGTVAQSFRWDLIVARRNWQPGGGETTFVALAGSGSAQGIPAARLHEPGVEDDQPIALVRVVAGQTLPTEIVDLRTWPSRTLMANSLVGLKEALPLGGVARVAGVDYHKVLDDTQNPILTPRDRKPFISVHRTSYTNVPSGFWPVAFDIATTASTPGMWNGSTRLTAAEEGLYLISGTMSWGAGGSGDNGIGHRACHLRFNNSGFVRGQSSPAVNGYWTTGNVQHVAHMTAGSYVELYSEQNTGAWVPVPGGGNSPLADSPVSLSMTYLMPAGGDGLARTVGPRPFLGSLGGGN